MIHTKIGINDKEYPLRIVQTPSDLFLREEFLEKDYFRLYRDDEKFEQDLEEFFHKLFYEEFIEDLDKANIIICLNYFLPMKMRKTMERILKKKFEADQVHFLSSQFTPIYMGNNNSGLIIDFSFTNFSFVPFYKG